jgi:hypothetical protein
MKALVQLTFGGGESFFVFGEVFGEAFAFGGDVDLALVGELHQSPGGAGVAAGECPLAN